MSDDTICPDCGTALKRRQTANGTPSSDLICPNEQCAVIKVLWRQGKKMVARSCA
jgi:hypothetical protein